MVALELPLARAEFSPEHVPEDYYYQLSVREVWKSYPIYHPDHEPRGYRDRLAELQPEVVFDPAKLVTEQDWIEAGAEVFHAPTEFDGPLIRPGDVTDSSWYEAIGAQVTPDGVFPYARWVIREKGKLEVGNAGCAMCHTRLMPDGSTIDGAQGNLPFGSAVGHLVADIPQPAALAATRRLFATPWEQAGYLQSMTPEKFADMESAIPPGVIARQGTSLLAPARVPDLIGIRDRKYLDATGLVIHRGIGDLMRYAALNQGMDVLARYGELVPAGRDGQRPPPGEGVSSGSDGRYSDEQLFALAQYLYSLEPPPNPNPESDLTRRGEEIFDSQGCADCHTPPLYTNNKLVPAPGFEPPAEHRESYDVMDVAVGTDPELAMNSRRGTGYYKVPSLKGVWYRGPLEHNGSVATLEDWFDPARIRDDYEPTGFRGTEGARAVPGHPFGLGLPDKDKAALIAFLRTL